jgi:hypothetical protein
MAKDLHYQCTLVQQCPSSLKTTVAWIPARGAIKGAFIELRGEEGRWRVETVGDHAVPGAQVRAKQDRDRGSLPSVSG